MFKSNRTFLDQNIISKVCAMMYFTSKGSRDVCFLFDDLSLELCHLYVFCSLKQNIFNFAFFQALLLNLSQTKVLGSLRNLPPEDLEICPQRDFFEATPGHLSRGKKDKVPCPTSPGAA